jgi:hypothetical protein
VTDDELNDVSLEDLHRAYRKIIGKKEDLDYLAKRLTNVGGIRTNKTHRGWLLNQERALGTAPFSHSGRYNPCRPFALQAVPRRVWAGGPFLSLGMIHAIGPRHGGPWQLAKRAGGLPHWSRGCAPKCAP